jgi:hypothetical protein
MGQYNTNKTSENGGGVPINPHFIFFVEQQILTLTSLIWDHRNWILNEGNLKLKET